MSNPKHCVILIDGSINTATNENLLGALLVDVVPRVGEYIRLQAIDYKVNSVLHILNESEVNNRVCLYVQRV